MVNIQALNEQVSVSGQIAASDLEVLQSLGVQTVVCNLPDDESQDKEGFSAIEKEARRLGINAVNIPFASGQHSAQDVAKLREQLGTGARIHAYCRTGNRSTALWRAASDRAK